MSDTDAYLIEGVIFSNAGGWLLALDRRFLGTEGDILLLDHTRPPVSLTVMSVVESDDGATRDVVVAPAINLHDPRLLTGHTARIAP